WSAGSRRDAAYSTCPIAAAGTTHFAAGAPDRWDALHGRSPFHRPPAARHNERIARPVSKATAAARRIRRWYFLMQLLAHEQLPQPIRVRGPASGPREIISPHAHPDRQLRQLRPQ